MCTNAWGYIFSFVILCYMHICHVRIDDIIEIEVGATEEKNTLGHHVNGPRVTSVPFTWWPIECVPFSVAVISLLLHVIIPCLVALMFPCFNIYFPHFHICIIQP